MTAMCEQPGCEGGSWRDPENNPITHAVYIVGPVEAAKANTNPELCCPGCAEGHARANIGFGWDVLVKVLPPDGD